MARPIQPYPIQTCCLALEYPCLPLFQSNNSTPSCRGVLAHEIVFDSIGEHIGFSLLDFKERHCTQTAHKLHTSCTQNRTQRLL